MYIHTMSDISVVVDYRLRAARPILEASTLATPRVGARSELPQPETSRLEE